jgi:peptidoglycan hydrolase CwlO-like protein
MQEDLRKQAKPDVRALQNEVERLQRENAEMRAHVEINASGIETQALLDENEQLRILVQQFEDKAASTSGGGDDLTRALNDLRAEVDLLNEDLASKEKILSDLKQGGDAEPLRTENDLLKNLLEDKSRLVEELSAKQTPKTENDLERYETELNDLRRQLENDRKKLNKEVEMLRDRNKELDEAIREMEMEMSKERAELGRERMRLERVRDEVKADAERLQRELAVRDSMAPVQKLRDELMQKQGPATGKNDKPLNDRLRSIRNQLSDSPAGS